MFYLNHLHIRFPPIHSRAVNSKYKYKLCISLTDTASFAWLRNLLVPHPSALFFSSHPARCPFSPFQFFLSHGQKYYFFLPVHLPPKWIFLPLPSLFSFSFSLPFWGAGWVSKIFVPIFHSHYLFSLLIIPYVLTGRTGGPSSSSCLFHFSRYTAFKTSPDSAWLLPQAISTEMNFLSSNQTILWVLSGQLFQHQREHVQFLLKVLFKLVTESLQGF